MDGQKPPSGANDRIAETKATLGLSACIATAEIATKTVVTIFPDKFASTKREKMLTLDDLANLMFVKRIRH